jgi:hypothetical protein
MTDAKVPRAPAGTKASGRRLWASILAEYELEEHELALLKEMVRTVDMLDDLAGIVGRDGPIARGPGLGPRAHPALVRGPAAGDRAGPAGGVAAAPRRPGDAKVGTRRPQRRVGARGVSQLRGAS